MSDFATLGHAHATGLTRGVGREVVVVHVTAPLVRSDRVELLLHARHAESRHIDDLGLTTLEQGRTVRHREEVDLSRERTDISGATAVDTHSLVDDAATHDLLGERLHGGLDFANAVQELWRQLGNNLGRGGVDRLGARGLLRNGVGGRNLARTNGLHASHDVVFVVTKHGVGNGLNRTTCSDVGLDEFALQVDRLADPQLGLLETVSENVLVHLRCAIGVHLKAAVGSTGLHHHDGDVGFDRVGQRATGHDDFKGRGVAFGEGRVRHPLTIGAESQTNGTDGAVEGNARDHESGRRGVDCQHVVRVLLVGREDGADDLDLVTEALRERRTQWSVD